jgi:hypothetical protein
MTWVYPYTIANGDPPDASKLQGLFDFARRKVNSITDGEITGISEGGTPPRVNFDPVAGHDHDGTGETAIILAQMGLFTIQGAVKVAAVTVAVPPISFSTNLMLGTGLTRAIMVWAGYLWVPSGFPSAAYINDQLTDSQVDDNHYYVVVNPAGATDEVYVFNGIGSNGGFTGGGLDLEFRVLLVGI